MHPQPLFSFEIFGSTFAPTLYGIFIAIGIVACLIIFKVYTNYKKVNTDVQDFVFFTAIAAIAFGFLAAKFYQAVYNWIEKGVFDFYSAGITAMGGFIGGAVGFLAIYFGIGHFIFKGKKKGIHIKEFNKVLLVAPCCITVAHAFGRIGCLMAGCCHGAYLGQNPVAGGIYMNGHSNGWGYYVPTQLYESIFLFLLFGVLSLLYYKRFNITHIVYLAAYGAWRFIIEFFRGDERGAFVLGLAPSQWQSVVFIALALGIVIFFLIKKIPFRLKEEETTKKEEVQSSDPPQT